jgi:HD-GYP domain-containing protein (c-di-GMP phosphodiesterase class II)
LNDNMIPAIRPGDERLRELGSLIIMRLLALVRVGRSYDVANQAFHQQVLAFIESLGPVFAEAPEAVLVSLDSDLYLNGVRLPVRTTNLRSHQSLMEEFGRRGIAGLHVRKGVTPDEIGRFFRLFLRPDLYHGPALLQACLTESTGHVLPAVHASTESEDAAVPSDPEGSGSTEESAAAGQVAPGPGSPRAGGGAATAAEAGGVRPVVPKSYSLALLGARTLLTTTVLQEGMELRHAKRVVQPLIDGAFAGEPVVVGLSSLGRHDESTYVHAVNVCVAAVTMGHQLGLDRAALADLGVASLLHDVGKATVCERIGHSAEEMDDEEQRWAESHPLQGAKLIARSTAFNSSALRCMRVALEHHVVRAPLGEGPSPAPTESAGYPTLPSGWRTSVLSGIVSAADCFVSLQMHRSERGRSVTPYQALGMMLGPLAGHFDPVLLWALVNSVGFYPPGQLVELSDGRTAVVLAPNPHDLARPHLRVITDECGVPCSPGEAGELRPLPVTLSVTRALAAHEYPEVPQAA